MKKNNIGYLIIASAIIWGAVIVGCALVLRGTPDSEPVRNILIGGVIAHLLFIWAPLGKRFRDKQKEESKE